MAAPSRTGKSDNLNEAKTLNPQQQVLSVTPLNSVPYIGPPSPFSYTCSQKTRENGEAMVGNGPRDLEGDERIRPAIIFLPSSTQPELTNVVASSRGGVALTGTAARGKIGSAIGLVDIGECEDSYFFQVSLPGVALGEKEFNCEIEPNGVVLIKGVTTTGEKIVCKDGQVFQMLSKNLCPPGHFSISFQLPGAVDNQHYEGSFTDGILEVSVKKL